MRTLWSPPPGTCIWFPLRRPSEPAQLAEQCSPARVRCAAPQTGGPLLSAHRSADGCVATGGSAENQIQKQFLRLAQDENQVKT
jgi:hypothetical protein